MKKILFSAIALTTLVLSEVHANKEVHHKSPLSATCEEKCNAQGKRVDVVFSGEEGECKCSTGLRGS